ncbi:hypothetical protein [Spiroplasma taiwanense]|uniref:Uncharacterized protein n=1 Tax=Spiroplasma taiwanense CT-1 TaxID=1276220 RepID=S5LX45_9MOLU|nr:hypothetical protein [Spiroplasma taiwanense]AGR41201.1 hypothetical protein STAIW_v1c05790 [Spiroplasma taiwanense CT-1]
MLSGADTFTGGAAGTALKIAKKTGGAVGLAAMALSSIYSAKARSGMSAKTAGFRNSLAQKNKLCKIELSKIHL